MTDTTSSEAPRGRVTVILRRPKDHSSIRSLLLPMAALTLALTLGAGLGFQGASVLGPYLGPAKTEQAPQQLTKRVAGGVYALELAKPQGQARWMLEFDAEIKTKDGPKNPAELRNALERLVIEATTMPVVQVAKDPSMAMRTAILAIAAQDYPWLVDIYMTRSDLRAPNRKLEGLGASIRQD